MGRLLQVNKETPMDYVKDQEHRNKLNTESNENMISSTIFKQRISLVVLISDTVSTCNNSLVLKLMDGGECL